jgi:putative FmdB family regulatory protein
MPIYEYECGACGRRLEAIQKFSDPPLEKCPTCGGPLHKLQAAPAFQFKGSGWYATDYGGKKAEASEKPKTDAAEKKPDSPEKKTESAEKKTGPPKAAAG